MAYILNGVTLPNPKKLTTNIIEAGAENLTLNGITNRRIINRKEQYVLEYQYLTQAQITSIINLYNLEEVLTFTITEDNLSVPLTNVLMDLSGLEYPPSGTAYLENAVIILTEVI